MFNETLLRNDVVKDTHPMARNDSVKVPPHNDLYIMFHCPLEFISKYNMDGEWDALLINNASIVQESVKWEGSTG